MAKKKLSKIQHIPGMKVHDGSDGPEMYATDPGFRRGRKWLGLMWEERESVEW